jgi:hypothetical protein
VLLSGKIQQTRRSRSLWSVQVVFPNSETTKVEIIFDVSGVGNSILVEEYNSCVGFRTLPQLSASLNNHLCSRWRLRCLRPCLLPIWSALLMAADRSSFFELGNVFFPIISSRRRRLSSQVAQAGERGGES